MNESHWRRFVLAIHSGHTYNPNAKSNALTIAELLGPDDGPWRPWKR